MSGHLECNLLDATGLRDTQLLGRQDVYVIFQVGTVRQQSKVKKDGGTKPAWNQRIQLGLFQASAAPQMLVEVFATSALGKDDHLGSVVVDLTRVQRSGMEDVKAALRTKDNRSAGQVQLILKWIPADGFAPGKPQAGAAAWPFAGGGMAPGGGYPPPAAPASGYPPPAVGGGYPAPAAATASYPPPATHGSGAYPPPASAAPTSAPAYPAAVGAAAGAYAASPGPAPAPAGYPPAVPPSHVAPPQQPVMHAAAAPPPAGYYGAQAPYSQPYYAPAPGYAPYPPQYPPASHHTAAMAAMGGMMAGAAMGAYPTYSGGYHYGKHKYKGMKYKHKRFKGMKGFKWK